MTSSSVEFYHEPRNRYGYDGAELIQEPASPHPVGGPPPHCGCVGRALGGGRPLSDPPLGSCRERTKQPATVPTKPPEPSTTEAPYSCSEAGPPGERRVGISLSPVWASGQASVVEDQFQTGVCSSVRPPTEDSLFLFAWLLYRAKGAHVRSRRPRTDDSRIMFQRSFAVAGPRGMSLRALSNWDGRLAN